MYIPESYIIETGYDQNNNFVIASSLSPYSGYYHKDKDNRYWTGETHTSNSLRLTRVANNNPIDTDYILKNNVDSYGFTSKFDGLLDTKLYTGDFIQPTSEDYNRGYFTRYFAQLKTSKTTVELNKENYNELTNDNVSLISYNTAALIWKLVGPLNDIYNKNIRIEAGIKDTNLRSIQNGKRNINDIDLTLTDPLQFAKITSVDTLSPKYKSLYITDYGVIRENIDMSVSSPPTPSVTPTNTPSISVTPTVTPSKSISATPSITPTTTPSVSISVTPSITATPSVTATVTPSISVSVTPSITPTVTPSISVSVTPSVTPSISISVTPSITATPSVTATVTPSISVSATPSVTPSISVSVTPSETATPSVTPTITPTVTPSVSISSTPSITPSETATPSITPSETSTPSVTPTVTPSISVSVTPSVTITPTITPTVTPSISVSNSVTPSVTPSITPSETATPSVTPTVTPSISVSVTPSVTVTPSPSNPLDGEYYNISISSYNACFGPHTSILLYDADQPLEVGEYLYQVPGGNDKWTMAEIQALVGGTGDTYYITGASLTPGSYLVVSGSAGDAYVYNSGLCVSPSPSVSTTPSITPSVSITPTVSPTVTPSISVSNSVTPSLTPTVTPSTSVTPTITPTVTPSISATPSITPTITPTVTPSISVSNSVTPSITPSVTPSISATPSITPTITPTVTPSISVSNSVTPSVTPSITPSISRTPSVTPTVTPTVTPSISVSVTPSITITPSPSTPATIALASTATCRLQGNCNDNAYCGVKYAINTSRAPIGSYITLTQTGGNASVSLLDGSGAGGYLAYYEDSGSETATFDLRLYNSGGTLIAQQIGAYISHNNPGQPWNQLSNCPDATPSPTPSNTPSRTPSVTPTPTPSVTPSPDPSPAPSPDPSPSSSPAATTYDVYIECGGLNYYYVFFNTFNTFHATINYVCCEKVDTNVTQDYINTYYGSAIFFADISNDNCPCV